MTEVFLNIKIKGYNEKTGISESSRITLTNNEIKDGIKVRIIFKQTTKKSISQEGGFLNFLRPLMSFGLPLMKQFITPLTKSVLVTLGLTAASSATDAAIQKNIFGLGTTAMIISNKIYHENS